MSGADSGGTPATDFLGRAADPYNAKYYQFQDPLLKPEEAQQASDFAASPEGKSIGMPADQLAKLLMDSRKASQDGKDVGYVATRENNGLKNTDNIVNVFRRYQEAKAASAGSYAEYLKRAEAAPGRQATILTGPESNRTVLG